MIDNSERNYFDYATDNTQQIHQAVGECRNWRSLRGSMSNTNIIKHFASKVFFLSINPSIKQSNGIKYVVGLVKDIFASVIEEDNKINNATIENIFSNLNIINNDEREYIDELKTFCKNVIDTKRMKKNHEIITKRYNFKNLLLPLKNKYASCQYELCITPFIFSVCRKLDTYNLELTDKINLMCEEIAYLLSQEWKYAWLDNDIVEEHRLALLEQIIPGVITYILGTYSAEGIPSDVFDKVLTATSNKINNSSFFKANNACYGNSEYFKYILGGYDKETSFFSKLAKAQKDGSINTKEGLLKLINDLVCNPYNLRYIYGYLIYFYGIFTNSLQKYNISVRKMINYLVSKEIEKKDPSNVIWYLKAIAEKTSEFTESLKPVVLFTYGKDKEFIDRYRKIVLELDALIVDLTEKIYYFENKDKSVNNESKDIYDDTGLPLTLSNYEKNILASTEFMIERLDESVEDKQNFIDIVTDKAILVNREATQFLSRVLDEDSSFLDLDILKDHLQASYKIISEDQSIDTTASRYIALGEISNLISKINKIKNNQQSIDESFDIIDYDSSNINNMIKDIVSKNIGNYIISETVHSVVEIPVHEMKISSYAKLVLDKFRQGVDYLDDKQKAICDSLDRLVDRFSHFDDKEARAEARMQILKGDMLPSLSRCLKSILLVGFLSIINPWIGLLALVVKYVSSRNATRQERQAVCDELEVEIQMIDRKINDAVEDKDYKLERKLRILKKKMLVQYSKISYDNMVKWDRALYMKSDTDETGRKIDLKED